MTLRITVDTSTFNSGIRATTRGLAAMQATLSQTGEGEVLTSRRRKLPGEKGRAMHGRGVANILRTLGHDPFGYPQSVEQQVGDFVARETDTALEQAWRMGVHRREVIKRALERGADDLATWAADNIKRGGLGQKKIKARGNTRAMIIGRMRRLVSNGVWTDKYGFPPPYGVRSGQFVDGIRSTWKLGARGRSDG